MLSPNRFWSGTIPSPERTVPDPEVVAVPYHSSFSSDWPPMPFELRHSVLSRASRPGVMAALMGSLTATAPAALLPVFLSATATTAMAAPTPLEARVQSGSFWAQVKGDNVMIRSGPSVQSAYAVGRLTAGTPIKVLAVEYGWAKVAAVGPAFSSLFGYIKSDGSSSYDSATKTLTITGKADLFAANMDVGYAPEKSWKQLGSVATGERLAVVDVKTVGPDTFYAVRMPASTEVWVNNQFLAAMTQEEADAIEKALASGGAVPQPMVVTPTPTVTPAPAQTPPAQAPNTPTPTPAVPPTATEGTAAGAITNNPPTTPAVDPETERLAAEAAAAAKAREDAERKAQEEAAAERRRQQMERQLRQVTYADLEAKWKRVRNEPAESAELAALRERYLALAEDPITPSSTRQLSNGRAEQIAVRIDVQNSLLELAERQRQRERTIQGVADLEIAMKQRMPYDAMGRLNASTVYDGDRLPLLYKLADEVTGHTLAYVMPGPGSKPSEALGLLVGIKGVRRYDETLRVNVIVPESIDVLERTASASTAPAAPTTPAATPE
jgi:hypothetical protein